LYSAVRLYCSTNEKGRSLNEIIAAFRIERHRAEEILQFLVETGLVEFSQGMYLLGTQRTFLARSSPFLPQHHTNWRVAALARIPRLQEEELMYTCPLSISKEDFGKLREMFIQLIDKSSVLIKESKAEGVACLNVDLFWITEDEV
jgi:hypothetical protein